MLLLLLLLLLLLPPRAALPSSSDPWLSASLRAFVRGLCRAPMSVGRRIATASISIFSNHQHTLFYGFACLPFPPDSGIADLAMAPGFTWQRRLPVQATRDILAGKSLTLAFPAHPHLGVQILMAPSVLVLLSRLSPAWLSCLLAVTLHVVASSTIIIQTLSSFLNLFSLPFLSHSGRGLTSPAPIGLMA
ncbi:hypothetical protein IWX46DRAFT_580983 [Phyllosticta citricarpa]|uniref:Secreted protein n=1 Tax=Phyllosticta citricarpa TaxID=55181 RepID=A0ABR1MF14_9PEZI